jgi:hypothetical protein
MLWRLTKGTHFQVEANLERAEVTSVYDIQESKTQEADNGKWMLTY